MGKLDELMKSSRGIASESMGRPQAPAMNRASALPAAGAPDRLHGVSRSRNAAEIPLGRIAPDPDQPREEFEAEGLARLAESLKARGQLQPIRVRWDEARGLYVIVCGERRWRAAGLAGLQTMSCIVMEGPVSPDELLSLQVIENMLREDLRPVEQAKAFRALMERNGWSTHTLARELAVDQSSVVRALKLLELPPAVQEHVERGALSPATAYELSKVGDPGAQAELVDRVLGEGLSRAETAQAVRQVSGRAGGARPKGRGGKPRKVTSRVLKTSVGVRVTLECRRGLDGGLIRAALGEALAQAAAELSTDDQAAA
jgi:ParB family chromosome partitioning protein